jgi:hypothetical protein
MRLSHTNNQETEKPSNPKDSVGIRRVPFSTVPMEVTAEVGLAMLEGALKYGRHNYRTIGVRSSVYFDAALRHLVRWWEGEDIDPDSGLPHIVKALASLYVLRDSQITGLLNDDRPPPVPEWANRMNEYAGKLIDQYPEPKPAYTMQVSEEEWVAMNAHADTLDGLGIKTVDLVDELNRLGVKMKGAK